MILVLTVHEAKDPSGVLRRYVFAKATCNGIAQPSQPVKTPFQKTIPDATFYFDVPDKESIPWHLIIALKDKKSKATAVVTTRRLGWCSVEPQSIQNVGPTEVKLNSNTVGCANLSVILSITTHAPKDQTIPNYGKRYSVVGTTVSIAESAIPKARELFYRIAGDREYIELPDLKPWLSKWYPEEYEQNIEESVSELFTEFSPDGTHIWLQDFLATADIFCNLNGIKTDSKLPKHVPTGKIPKDIYKAVSFYLSTEVNSAHPHNFTDRVWGEPRECYKCKDYVCGLGLSGKTCSRCRCIVHVHCLSAMERHTCYMYYREIYPGLLLYDEAKDRLGSELVTIMKKLFERNCPNGVEIDIVHFLGSDEFGQLFNPLPLPQVFKAMDLNGDGCVNFSEFISYMAVAIAGTHIERGYQLLRTIGHLPSQILHRIQVERIPPFDSKQNSEDIRIIFGSNKQTTFASVRKSILMGEPSFIRLAELTCLKVDPNSLINPLKRHNRELSC